MATGEALHLRGLDFEKFFACGGREGGWGETQSTPGPSLKQSVPQTNSKALFSLYAAAAGRCESIRGFKG